MSTVKTLASAVAKDLISPKYDPVPAYKFYVFVDMGIMNLEFTGGFSNCSGLSMTRGIQSIEEGGLNHFVHKLPNRSTFGNVTLTRGLAFSSTLSKWFFKELENGGTARYPVTIMQYSSYFPAMAPARFYHLNNAFPVSWTGPSLDVDSTSIAVETLEIAFDDMQIETVAATEALAVVQMAAGTIGRAVTTIASAVNG